MLNPIGSCRLTKVPHRIYVSITLPSKEVKQKDGYQHQYWCLYHTEDLFISSTAGERNVTDQTDMKPGDIFTIKTPGGGYGAT